MKNNTRPNDWMDILVSNPGKDFSDFALAGVNDKNTTLRSRDFYRENPVIKQMFTDKESGEFDNTKFNQYYDSASRMFNQYIQSDMNRKALGELNFDYSDLNRLPKEQTSFYIQKVANPTGSTKGISSAFGYTEGNRSMREAAQTQNVFNYETGKFEDWTPNDDDKRGLFDFLGIPPLVEARWEEDGTHLDLDGRIVKHKAGDYKLNANGMPYYETLGGRDASNKEFLHITDTLTVDGSTWNKWDVFDTDGKEKSIAGQTLKIGLTIAPLFIPYVNTAYGLTAGAVLLSQALSQLSKAGLEALDENATATNTWKMLNSIDAFGRGLERSVSDSGNSSMLNYEQLTNIIGDVVGQFYQQRSIAKIPTMLGLDKKNSSVIRKFVQEHGDDYLKAYGKNLTEAIKAGDLNAKFALNNVALKAAIEGNQKMMQRAADMSKLYMVLTQTGPMYDQFKEYGFDEQTTAIGLLGTALGFHQLFKTSLGDLALKGIGLDDVGMAVKPVTEEMAKGMRSSLVGKAGQAVGEQATSTAQKLTRVREYANKFADTMKTLWNDKETASNMLKEGLEEVSEEMLQDTILQSAHSINEALSVLGFKRNQDTYNYMQSNPLERYLMSGLGGAVGGALFPQITKYESWLANESKARENINKSDLINLERTIREQGIDAVERVIQQQIKRGEFGSTSLSMIQEDTDGDQIVYKPAQTPEESQNYVIGNTILNIAKAIDATINAEGANLKDAEIVNSVLGKDLRLTELSKSGIDKDIVNDFQNVLNRLIDVKAKLRSVPDGETNNDLNAAYRRAKEDFDDLVSGKRSGEYAERMAFFLNKQANLPFINSDITAYAYHQGINYAQADDQTKARLEREFAAIKKDDAAKRENGFRVFKHYRDLVQPELLNFMNSDIKNVRKQVQKFLESVNDPILKSLVTDEQKDAIRKVIRGTLSEDEFIAEHKLNENNIKLTPQNKAELINKHVEALTSEAVNNEIKSILWNRMQEGIKLGVDPNLFVRNKAQLEELVNGLQQLGTSLGYLDSQTIKMVQSVIDAYNSVDINKIVDDAATGKLTGNAGLGPVGFTFEMSDLPSNHKLTDYVIDALLNSDPDGDIEDHDLSFGRITETELYEFWIDGSQENGTVLFDRDQLNFLLNRMVNMSGFNNVNKLIGGLLDENGKLSSAITYKTKGIQYILDQVQNYVNSPEVAMAPQLLQTAYSLTKANAAKNPIWDMLSKISLDLTGEDVFNLIKEEEGNYKALDKLADYVINNSIRESQLKVGLSVIDILMSTINFTKQDEYLFNPVASTFSFHDIINKARRNNGEPELAVVSEKDAHIVLQDLKNLKNTIETLLELSEKNSGSKTLDNTKALVRNEGLLIKLLAGDLRRVHNLDNFTYEDSDGTQVPFFDYPIAFPDIINKAVELNSADPDDLNVVDREFTNMQKYYYDKFGALSSSQQEEIIDRISSSEYFNYRNNIESKIKKNTEVSDLSPEFISQFIISTLAIDQKNLKSEYFKVLQEDDSKYAPFFGQYLNISMSMAMILNPTFVNDFLSKWKSNSNIAENTDIPHPNFVANNGDPGTGKTTAVAYYIDKLTTRMLDNPSIKIAAPETDQATKFANLLGYDNAFNKYTLFESLLTESGMDKYNKMMEGVNSGELQSTAYATKNGTFRSDYFKPEDIQSGNIPDLLFVDEYTHYSSFELEALSDIGKVANRNLIVVAFGDTKQDGFKVHGSSRGITGYIYKTPELTMSIRSNNNHKKDNVTILSTLLRRINEKINYNKANRTIVDLNDDIDKIQNEITLKYFESIGDNGEISLQGDKLVNSVEEKYLRGLISDLNDGEKLVLITNKLDSDLSKTFAKLNSEFGDKVITKEEGKVQGSEYKYIVVDVEYNQIKRGSPDIQNTPFLTNLKSFYTDLTRSADGSIIIANPTVLVKSSTRVNYSSKSELSNEDISAYKTMILTSLSNTLGQEIQAPDNSRTSIPETPTIDIQQVDREVEQRREEISADDNTDEFKKNNIQVQFRVSHLGLYNDNGKFTKTEENEDLSGFLESGTEYTEQDLKTFKVNNYSYDLIQSLYDFKNLLGRNREDINLLLDTLETPPTNLIPFISRYFEDFDDFKTAIKERGSYKLKLSRYNNLKDRSYGIPDAEGYVPNDIFSRVVFQIKLKNGETLDITLATLSDPKNIQDTNNPYKRLVTNRATFDKLKDGPRYYNIKEGENLFQMRGITINGDTTYNRTYTLKQYKQDHPELNFTNDIYLPTEGDKRGYPFVFISSDAFYDESELLSTYGSENPFVTSRIPVDFVGYTFEEFFNEWGKRAGRNLSKKDKKSVQDLSLFMPRLVAPKILSSLYRTQDLLEKADIESIEVYNKTAIQYNEENASQGLQKRLLPTDQASIEALAKKVRNILQLIELDDLTQGPGEERSKAMRAYLTLDDTTKNLDKHLRNAFQFIKGEDFPLAKGFTKSEYSLLSKSVKKSGNSLYSTLEKLMDPDNVLYNDAALITGEAKDTFISKVSAMKKIIDNLSKEIAGVDTLTLDEALKDGFLFSFSNEFDIVSLINIKMREGDESMKNALFTALDVANYFPKGIFSNGRDPRFEPRNGYLKSALNDDQVYIKRDFRLPNGYVNYEAFDFSEPDGVTTPTMKPTDTTPDIVIENKTIKNSVDQYVTNILNNPAISVPLRNRISETIAKQPINNDANIDTNISIMRNIIDKELRRYKRITEGLEITSYSLDENGDVKVKIEGISKSSLLNHNEDLESILDEFTSINPEYINEGTFRLNGEGMTDWIFTFNEDGSLSAKEVAKPIEIQTKEINEAKVEQVAIEANFNQEQVEAFKKALSGKTINPENMAEMKNDILTKLEVSGKFATKSGRFMAGRVNSVLNSIFPENTNIKCQF